MQWSFANSAPRPLFTESLARRRSAALLAGLLGATLVFNLLDIMLTISVVVAGLAVEANPVMAKLLAHSPVHFTVAKLVLVSAGVHVLWRERHRTIAMVGSVCVFGVYLSLMFYHVNSLRALFG